MRTMSSPPRLLRLWWRRYRSRKRRPGLPLAKWCQFLLMRSIMAPPMRSRVSSLAWLLLDAHKGHPLALHLLHPQDVVAHVHLVADLRRSAQLAEYEAAYSVEVLALESGAHDLIDRPDGDASVHRVGSVLEPLYVRLLLVELVADLAHDLLYYVLHRHDPLERSP